MDEIDSTNTYLLNHPEHLSHPGLVVITARQTAGKGRLGRRFVSLADKNLTFSIALHPSVSMELIGIYSLLAGIGVARALEPLLEKAPRLKWPNDILIGTRKICGILLESTSLKNQIVLVMGIGVNCLGQPEDYPEDLQSIVTTMAQESTRKIEMESVFQQILMHLNAVLDQFDQQGSSFLLEEWLVRASALNQRARYQTQNGWSEGVIEQLSPEGYLMIRTPEGKLFPHISGDVQYIG
ncbi:MAG: biotin--[acetyl-CoA-carboxylase] ligase [SAR324 cluster bacterium]|nr:biotin--[acetyl-CoA-carboxylase] ligase [SAR324 cluster bacterium]